MKDDSLSMSWFSDVAYGDSKETAKISSVEENFMERTGVLRSFIV